MIIDRYKCTKNVLKEVENFEENDPILPNIKTQYCLAYKKLESCDEVYKLCSDSSLVYDNEDESKNNIKKNSNAYIYKIVCSKDPNITELGIKDA